MLRSAKKSFYSARFQCVTPSRNLWNSLHRLGLLSDTDDIIPPFTVDELNVQFTGGNPYFSFPTFVNTTNNPVLHAVCPVNSSFSFHSVTDSEVILAISGIKSNSEGLDNIPIGFIKLLLPLISLVVTHIFNSVLTKSVFPNYWKVSKLLRRHKHTCHHTLNDYRPISMLPSLSKALERIIKMQISDHLR